MKKIILPILMGLLALMMLMPSTSLSAATEYAAEVTIGGKTTQYEDLNNAWTAACQGTETNPATIKLLKDVTQTTRLTSIAKGVTIILDLNDKVLTFDCDDDAYGIDCANANITVIDNADVKTKKYYTCNDDGLWVRSDEATALSAEGGIITNSACLALTSSLYFEKCNVLIENISFIGCDVGVLRSYCFENTLTIKNTNFIGNVMSFKDDSVIYIENGINTVENCLFEGNAAGANVFEFTINQASPSGSISMNECTIRNNKAYTNSSDAGKAVLLIGMSATLEDCVMSENTSTGDGGGICINTPDTVSEYATSVILKNCTISKNSATLGGGIYSQQELTVQNCNVCENTSTDKGGGIYSAAASSLFLYKTVVKDNKANVGGGIYKNEYNFAGVRTVLIETTITGNTASETAGGMFYNFDKSCFVAGTKISMADGTSKKIEDIQEGDVVKTFDHENGCFSSAKVYLCWKEQITPSTTFKLHFDNDLTLQCVTSHSFLEKTSRKYQTLSIDNAESYIGKYFFGEDGQWHQLLDVTVEEKTEWRYELYTSSHQNCFTDGILSVPADVSCMLNLYELDENLKADAKQLQADIEKYGLADYETAFELMNMSRQWFDDSNAKYTYIAIGKGLLSLKESQNIYASSGNETSKVSTNTTLNTQATQKIPTLADYSDYENVLTLGKNVTITDNTVGTERSNLYIEGSIYVRLDTDHSGLKAGIALKNGTGQFTVNGTDADRSLFFNDPDLYAVHLNENGYLELIEGCKITETADEHGTISVGDNKCFYPGDTVTVTVAADEEYIIDKVYYQAEGGELTEITPVNGIYCFAMPDKATTVSASIKKEHNWSYTLAKTNADNDTIVASCGVANCAYQGTDKTLTIVAPTSLVYDGTNKNATLNGATTFLGKTELPEITYQYRSTNQDSYTDVTDTSKIGHYKASITVDTVTAFVEYDVKPITVIVQPENKTMNIGDAVPELTANVTGLMGNEKIVYSFKNIETPTTQGIYSIIADGDRYQGNYEVIYKTGILTVTCADKEAKANSDDLARALEKYQTKEQYNNKTLDIELRTDGEISQDEKNQISKKTGDKTIQYYDAEIYLIINDNGQISEKNIGDENDELISITYSFNFTNKSNIQVLRLHDNNVDEITQTPNEDGEYYQFDKKAGTIIVTAKKYSTYAIAYNEGNVPSTGDLYNIQSCLWVDALALGAILISLLAVRKTKKVTH